jgi:hypothetical protein
MPDTMKDATSTHFPLNWDFSIVELPNTESHEPLGWDRNLTVQNDAGQSLDNTSLSCRFLDLATKLERLKDECPKSAYFLSLLCYAVAEDMPIPNAMFGRPLLTQERWNCQGEAEIVPKSKIVDENSFKRLESRGLIIAKNLTAGGRTWLIPSNVRQRIHPTPHPNMQLAALDFVCEIFPKNPDLDML